MTTTTPTPAREYLRVSLDRSGRERSITEQQEDNRRAWSELSFNGAAYSDKSISASRYSTKRRGGFGELTADLASARFGADVLVLWEPSRGSRRVGEWSNLLDLAEAAGVRIAVTEHRRIYDPTNPRDRRSVLEDAVDAEYESGKTAGRVRRAARANAVERRPHGKLLFGYERIRDPRTGRLAEQVPHPEQAPVVRRVFADFCGGRSLRSIAEALNAEGVRTNRGNGWTPLMIRRMLTNRGYLGHRVHKGEDFGRGWTPLVDEATFDAAAARLASISWRRPRVTNHLLSGVARCGRCGSKLEVKRSKGTTWYGCQDGYCTYRNADDLDRWITAAVVGRLSRPDVGEALSGTEDPRVAEASAERDRLRAELDEAMTLWKAGKLSVAGYAEMEGTFRSRLAEAERAVRSAAVPIELDVPEGEAVPAWWDALAHEQRREVVAALIAAVVVAPVGRGARRIDWQATTRIEWRR